MKTTEHLEQKAFCQYLDLKKIPYFAIPNGIFLSNKKLAYKIINKMKREGFKVGVPDMFICVPKGKYSGLFVEMKKDKKCYASKEQKKWLRILNDEGYKAIVCHGCSEAIEEYKKYMED